MHFLTLKPSFLRCWKDDLAEWERTAEAGLVACFLDGFTFVQVSEGPAPINVKETTADWHTFPFPPGWRKKRSKLSLTLNV